MTELDAGRRHSRIVAVSFKSSLIFNVCRLFCLTQLVLLPFKERQFKLVFLLLLLLRHLCLSFMTEALNSSSLLSPDLKGEIDTGSDSVSRGFF